MFAIFIPCISADDILEHDGEQSSEIEESKERKTRPVRLAIGVGGIFGGLREETDSTINHYFTLLTFHIDGNVEQGNFLHTFSIGGNFGYTTLPYEDKYPNREFEFMTIRANMEYALDYRLWGDDTFPGFLGGAFRTDFHILVPFEIPKITAIASLGVHATQKWIIDPKHSLSLSVTVPLFSYAVRPPYVGVDELFELYTSQGEVPMIFTLGKFASLHNYWALFGDLKYHFRLIDLISLNAGFGFELSRINIPAPLIIASTRLYAGVAFTF
jgi:hypothetical protein